MTLSEKYWLTILLTICRYLSIVLLIGPAGFIFAGYFTHNWLWYLGLISWPLTIMLGVVNMRYLQILLKTKKLGWSKIMEE